MSDSGSLGSSSKIGKVPKKRFRATFRSKFLRSNKDEDTPASAGPTGQRDDAYEQALPVQISLQSVKQPNEAPGPISELWDEAYEELRTQDKELVENYEEYLRSDLAIMISSTVPLFGAKVERERQMRILLEKKIQQVKESTLKFKFGGEDILVKDLAKPVVGLIRWADDYISGALDSNPYASIAWAGVSVLLPFLLNPSEQAKSLTEGLEYISELIVRSKMREDLYELRANWDNGDGDEKRGRIQDALYRGTLKKLYIEILKFQANVIKYLSNNRAFRLGSDMVKWDDWDLKGIQTKEVDFCKVYDIRKDINAEKDVEKLLAHHREQSKDLSSISNIMSCLLELKEKEQAYGEFVALLNWLSSFDPSKFYNSGRDKVRAGTGEWLLSGNSTFDDWKTARNSFIWLNGKAGCGKSVLSSSIIKHLEDYYEGSPVIAIAFFYFRFDDTETQSVDKMLCSLIKQICAQRPNTPESVKSLQKYKLKDHRPDRKTLEDALIATIQNFNNVYIVLDALDECPSSNGKRGELLKVLRQIHDQQSPNLHLICTSRRETDIERVLEYILSPTSEFNIDLTARKENVDRDIALHIDETFRSDETFCSWEAEWRDEARNALIEKADGMFQYVALQFETLKRHSNKTMIRKALRELPMSLDDTYNRILENIYPEYRRQVISTLKWLAFSLRPLYVEEVAEIFILDHEETNLFDDESRFKPVQNVLTYLSGLVTPVLVNIAYERPVWQKKNSKFTEIRFAHFSIQEYLVSERLRKSQSCFWIHEQASHLHIAESCLAYHLHLSKTMLATEETVETYILWQYAAEYWAFHLERVPRKLWKSSVRNRMDLTLESQSQALLNMIRVSEPDRPGYNFETALDTLAPPLYYTCRMGSALISLYLIEQGPQVNEISEHTWLGAPLHAAAFRGYNHVIMKLLQNGTDVNMLAGQFGSALATVAYRGGTEILQLLLDRGANINAEGGVFGSALATAACYGETETVQFLLDRGANVNAEGGGYRSALATAACYGETETVQFLLDRGANVNAEGGRYGNALTAAAYFGKTETVRLLLDRGANVNAEGGGYGSALATAACYGETETAQLLLDRGANVNAEGGRYGSALTAAVYFGKTETVRLLLDRGANVNAEGGRYGSALTAAAYFGKTETVRLLLDRGANVNAEGGRYGNTLVAAAYRGGTETVRLLLDRGANINAKGGIYGNALQSAIAEGKADCVELLLSLGAEIDPLTGQELEDLSTRLEEQEYGEGYRRKVIDRLRTYGENPAAYVEWVREKEEKWEREALERRERLEKQNQQLVLEGSST